ncbi:Transthyretin-like protein 46 [Toxocara canis]|uniref:Transthyretin-like protein 46 n=1 Tax=Toxocara canis TaxID=6265 RepID=A0A0B2VL82_TOXCA|nr:Transthyretin-like protein 46 [Toxocara canis]
MKPLLLACLVVVATADVPKFAQSITTRSTGAKGTFLCGKNPAGDVKVRLFRNYTDEPNEILAFTTSSAVTGKFNLEGHTAGRSNGDIEPFIRIYHRCDMDPKKKDYRTFGIKFPKSFVSIGRIARKPYDIGTMNLEIIYPKEKHLKEFKEESVPNFDKLG